MQPLFFITALHSEGKTKRLTCNKVTKTRKIFLSCFHCTCSGVRIVWEGLTQINVFFSYKGVLNIAIVYD